jgi:hypothetical protein
MIDVIFSLLICGKFYELEEFLSVVYKVRYYL